MATVPLTAEPSQPASPSVPPVPVYEELAPGIYRHILSDETVLAAEVLTFAETHPDSALHNCFLWDDEKAGTLWRLQQVRELLLNSLVVGPDGEPDMQIRTGE
jgi:hypothetical protein